MKSHVLIYSSLFHKFNQNFFINTILNNEYIKTYGGYHGHFIKAIFKTKTSYRTEHQ